MKRPREKVTLSSVSSLGRDLTLVLKTLGRYLTVVSYLKTTERRLSKKCRKKPEIFIENVPVEILLSNADAIFSPPVIIEFQLGFVEIHHNVLH